MNNPKYTKLRRVVLGKRKYNSSDKTYFQLYEPYRAIQRPFDAVDIFILFQ